MTIPLSRYELGEPTRLRRFVDDCWERGVCELRCEPLLSAQAAFETAVRYASVYDSEALVRVWADDHFVNFPRDLMFLARPEDRTFAGWAERASAAARVFGVRHVKAQVHGGWPLWERLERLLRPVFDCTGLMYGGTEASLISGLDHSLMPALQTWSKWDPAPNTGHLIFVASGRVNFTIDSQALSVGECTLLYAHARAQLDAVFDGVGCALVINLRSGTARARADRMLREVVIEHAHEHRLACLHQPHRIADAIPGDVPAALRETAAALRAHSTSETLATELYAAWRSYETGLGFAGSPPPSRDRELDGDARIAAHPGLRWTSYGDRLFVAAHGHVLRISDHPAVRALLSALVAGESGSAADLATQFCSDDGAGPSDEQVFALLQSLFQRHAITAAAVV